VNVTPVDVFKNWGKASLPVEYTIEGGDTTTYIEMKLSPELFTDGCLTWEVNQLTNHYKIEVVKMHAIEAQMKHGVISFKVKLRYN
jgi:hypothetical protein